MAVMAAKKKPLLSAADIKAIRVTLGLTQAEAAARIGVSQSVWSAWERGAKLASRQSVLLLNLLRQKKI